MRAQLLAGARMLLVMTLLLGLAYPLALTGISQVAFGGKADGSLLERDGRVVGSSLIGQTFTADEYFQGRPSAAGAAASASMVEVTDDDGNATGEVAAPDPNDLSQVGSSASNLGPTNEDLLTSVEERVAAFRELNGLDDTVGVPVDAVTASGSGLDPHISVANARLQANRVAAARGLDLRVVLDLVDENTAGRSLGIFGEKGVHVLELNLALDDAS